MAEQAKSQVMTVSEFNAITDRCLKGLGTAQVEGEISECRAYAHLYFKLKDETAVVDCMMFASNLCALAFKPEIGMKVVVSGQSSLYSKNGQFKLVAHSMRMAGRGVIMERLKALEEKLRKEGIFDLLSRSLPRLPDRVGIITSLEGRVVHDVAMTLKRRHPGIELRVYDAKVQGADAPQSLIAALRLANAEKVCDVLIIGRGGGSFEDLLAFSDEELVREVARSNIPIVSAVGHEPDVALSDFAADVRAATPTAAAELVSSITAADCRYSLGEYARRLDDAMGRFVDPFRMRLEGLQTRLNAADPLHHLMLGQSRLEDLKNRLNAALRVRALNERNRLGELVSRLNAADPLACLSDKRRNLRELTLRLEHAVSLEISKTSGTVAELYRRLEEASPRHALDERARVLASHTARLEALNPLSVLTRGYSVTLGADGRQATAGSVKVGDELTVMTQDGRIFSKVIGRELK